MSDSAAAAAEPVVADDTAGKLAAAGSSTATPVPAHAPGGNGQCAPAEKGDAVMADAPAAAAPAGSRAAPAPAASGSAPAPPGGATGAAIRTLLLDPHSRVFGAAGWRRVEGGMLRRLARVPGAQSAINGVLPVVLSVGTYSYVRGPTVARAALPLRQRHGTFRALSSSLQEQQ